MKRIGKGQLVKVNDLFEIYRKRLRAPEGSVKSVVIEVVSDLFGVTLTPAQIGYTPGSKILTIKAPGTIKTEMRLRKNEILAHLAGRLGEKSAPTEIV
jgi:hypothetical protein